MAVEGFGYAGRKSLLTDKTKSIAMAAPVVCYHTKSQAQSKSYFR